jgi:KaiC/GvpD/RAD55 family RecA-like ATPase
MVNRVATGIKGFDELIEGGFPQGSVTLVAGTPGTGKSIFCAQIAYNNSTKGKKCLYLDLEQKEGQLKNQLADFGLLQKKSSDNLKIINIDTADPCFVKNISKELAKNKYDVIVLDSIESIINSSAIMGENNNLGLDQIQETVVPTMLDTKTMGRIKLRSLFSTLIKTNATIFFVGEKVEGSQGLSRDTISEFLCDNIVSMNYIGMGAVDFRSLQIRKMRRSGHEKGYVLFEITNKGLKIIEDPLKKKK